MWIVEWEVEIDGTNVSAGMRDYLISIDITDKDGGVSDTCSLVLDDSEGQIILPPDGAQMKVSLFGVTKFEGTIDAPRSTGSRGGGMLLNVSAKGFDSRGKVKEPQTFHADDAKLEDFLGKAAQQAGLSGVVIDPEFAAIVRDYWAADGESFLHLGKRLESELHATFKIRGTTAVLAKRGEGKSPTGGALPAIVGRYPGNVINWDIVPRSGRKVYTEAKVSWFDRKAAEFKDEIVKFELDRETPASTNAVRGKAADKDQAQAIGKARKGEAERGAGSGSALLDMTEETMLAQAEATFTLTGAREGVDGDYRITTVKTRADRSGGATVGLDLSQPQKAAGKDARKPSKSPGATPQTTPAATSGDLPAPAADGSFQTGSGLLGGI